MTGALQPEIQVGQLAEELYKFMKEENTRVVNVTKALFQAREAHLE